MEEQSQEAIGFVTGALQSALELLQANWLNVVFAILIFVLGRWFAGIFTGAIKKGMKKKEVDPALISFLGSLLYYFILLAVVIAAVGKLGIQTTSLVAVIGAAGLAVGLALQGSLSNFAAGTLIILFKPFRIGDFIDAGGTMGIVEEIGVLMTILKSPDNKKIIAPNGAIMGGIITNITANPIRRIDMTWGVAYEDDMEKTKEVIMDELVKHPNVLEDPAPQVELWEFADSSVNFVVRPWVKSSDWWSTRCYLMIAIKKRLDAEGMSIPFPQRDVHMIKAD